MDYFKQESGFFSANDFLVPAVAVLAAAYFLVAGNLVVLALAAMLLFLAFNVWSGRKTAHENLRFPSLRP